MPFIVLRQAPLYLVFDDLIVVQILATNKIGSGPWCEPNIIGVRIQTEPIIPPSAPVILEYSEFSIEIEVSILQDQQTGGSEILRYDLIWDLGSLGDSWETYSYLNEVADSDTINVAIDGLTSGETYQFKYRAQNIHGWSDDYSAAVSVKTLTEPSAPQVPTTVENGD